MTQMAAKKRAGSLLQKEAIEKTPPKRFFSLLWNDDECELLKKLVKEDKQILHSVTKSKYLISHLTSKILIRFYLLEYDTVLVYFTYKRPQIDHGETIGLVGVGQ